MGGPQNTAKTSNFYQIRISSRVDQVDLLHAKCTRGVRESHQPPSSQCTIHRYRDNGNNGRANRYNRFTKTLPSERTGEPHSFQFGKSKVPLTLEAKRDHLHSAAYQLARIKGVSSLTTLATETANNAPEIKCIASKHRRMFQADTAKYRLHMTASPDGSKLTELRLSTRGRNSGELIFAKFGENIPTGHEFAPFLTLFTAKCMTDQ